FIYAFKDETNNPYSHYDNYGIVHNDLTPKKSYFAVARVTAKLAGTTASSILPATVNVPNGFDWENYQRWGFDSSDGTKSVVAFWFSVQFDGSTAGANVTVQWHHPDASKVSLYDPLRDAQTPVKWRKSPDSETVIAQVRVTASPQMLIIQ